MPLAWLSACDWTGRVFGVGASRFDARGEGEVARVLHSSPRVACAVYDAEKQARNMEATPAASHPGEATQTRRWREGQRGVETRNILPGGRG